MLYVLIDNGHGSNTPGKCSPDKTIREYLYTRELAAGIYERLQTEPNIKPILITPELQDIPLSTRALRANKYCNRYGANKCILISLHLNASGNGDWMKGKGWEVWTTRGQNNSDLLATMAFNIAIKLFGKNNTRADYTDGDPDKENDWTILKKANCPAILTESFFMDNKSDYSYLLSEEGFNNIVALHCEIAKQWAEVRCL